MRLLILAALLAAPVAQAQMYKCVDARGVTQYTDKPCPGGKGREVDIRGQPPISGTVTPYRDDMKAEEREFRHRQAQRERELDAEAKALEAQKRRCASLQAEVQRYSAQRRIATVDARGERVFMDDAAREARLAQLNGEIARQCR